MVVNAAQQDLALAGLLADPENAAKARQGFLHTLFQRESDMIRPFELV
jgi:hypothetical protein